MTSIVKVKNLSMNDGYYDYKGLDIDKIIGGSQLYPSDKNEAYFLYNGDVTSGGDLEVITQAVYDAEKTRMDSLPRPITTEQKIEEIKAENEILKADNVIIKAENAALKVRDSGLADDVVFILDTLMSNNLIIE